MKFYVCGRSSNYEQVTQTFDHLEEKGHDPVFNWPQYPMVKPYTEHPAETREFAEKSITGISAADVFIMFAHEDGNGVFSELGCALVAHTLSGSPRIMAVDETKQGSAMFYFHPAIEWFDSIGRVYEELGV